MVNNTSLFAWMNEDLPGAFYADKLGSPGPDAVSLKMLEEAEEARSAVLHESDARALAELADLVITALVTGESLGIRPSEIFAQVNRKLRKNMDREWGRQSDGSYHHIKESE